MSASREKKFLCLILLRRTGEQLAEYEIVAIDWYFARQQAANKYREENPDKASSDWCVDSLEL
jgi:hypothetical protein